MKCRCAIEWPREVCCHQVAIRYWDIGCLLTEDDEALLREEGERRAKEMICDGYSSGELNCLIDDREIRGWWEITKH